MFSVEEYIPNYPNSDTLLQTLGSKQPQHHNRSSMVIIAKKLKNGWCPLASDQKLEHRGPATVEIGSLDLIHGCNCPMDAFSYGYDDEGFVEEEREKTAVLTLGGRTINVFGQDFVVGVKRGIAVLHIDYEQCVISVMCSMHQPSTSIIVD